MKAYNKFWKSKFLKLKGKSLNFIKLEREYNFKANFKLQLILGYFILKNYTISYLSLFLAATI